MSRGVNFKKELVEKMRRDQFFYFLTHDFASKTKGLPLGKQAGYDAIARCRRIEKILKLNLDDILKGDDASLNELLSRVEENELKFNVKGNIKNGLTSIKNGAKRYNDFIGAFGKAYAQKK